MTRMWMLPTKILCKDHLLGEHNELHKIVGSINKGKLNTVAGHAKLAQVDTTLIRLRHEQLVKEMSSRNYNHRSPIPDFVDPKLGVGSIDSIANFKDLITRCPRCRERARKMLGV